jgi:hypothetical protein
MGIDHKASQQDYGLFRQGTDLAGSVLNLLTAPGADSAGLTEEAARLRELDARKQAAHTLRDTDREADRLREELERERAAKNTAWGASGLTMSGSKKLLRETARTADAQEEADIRAWGEREARDTLERARAGANVTRIHGSARPATTTLSLGSRIYKYGR